MPSGPQKPGGAPVPRINLPQAALDCVQAKLGSEAMKKILEGGQPNPETEQIVRGCMTEQLKGSLPPNDKNPIPSNIPRNPNEQCIQVITFAKDPMSGMCKQFSTPCAVPENWIKGCEPSSNTPPTAQPGFPPPANALPLPTPGQTFVPPSGVQPLQVPPLPDGHYIHSLNTPAPSKMANILSSPIQPFLKFLLGL